MSDKLENFIRNNRDQFDTQVPSNQVWNAIQTGLTQSAAAAGGAAAGGAGAGAAPAGLAKIALGWKVAVVAAALGVIGTGIYFVAQPGDAKDPGNQPSAMATPPSPADNGSAKVEYMYAASELVMPPLPSAAPGYLHFELQAEQGGKFSAPSGTEITVPAGVFVDAQGQPVTGDVDLRYREFHDAEDVLLSGITMVYDELGTKENFQTAGMMEILGYQDGKPVFIGEGKELDIKMASFTKDDDYKLYFLDPSKGWKDIGKAKLSKNAEKEAAEALLASKPRPPVKGTPGEMDGEVTFNVDFEDFPELRPFKSVRWMAEDKAAYAKLEERIMSKVWTRVQLYELGAEGLRYRISLGRKLHDSLSIDVKPILEGDDYARGMEAFQKKMDRYNQTLKDKGLEESRLASQADVYRSFSISGFGIYNCDRMYRITPVVSFRPEWIFPDDHYLDPKKTVIFHIAGDNRAVLTLSPGEREVIRMSPKEQNYLVIVLPDQKVGVVKPERCAEIMRQGEQHAKVEFEAQPQVVQNAADLRLALGI